jgi:3-hydroxy-9,10-secoandrosta-1,3,5(10)-triene-9,17-dione monooxygenase reductase component
MSIDKTLFRQVVGSFASGVTIITTGHEGSFSGLTANAFSSVSLDPTLVLICVDRQSQTLNLLQSAGRFNVNILAAHQESVSRLFATKSQDGANKLSQVDFKPGTNGLPIIDGVAASLECQTVMSYEGGDHIILVGEVNEASLDHEIQPLIFFRGGYRELAAYT